MATLPENFPFPAERDKENNIKVRADHFDSNMEYLIALINNCLSRFGANKIQGNIDANNKTFKNLATPTENGDAANKQYVDGKIQQILSKDPLITPALLQLATQDETLAGVVQNKAVSPAALALAISSAVSASANNLPYDFLGGFDLSFDNNTQITIGTGQAASSDNSRNIISDFVAKKDILTLWAPSNGQSTVVGCKPANVSINLWSRYNIFVISTDPQPATRGTFTTIDISANVDNFKGVSDGFLRVVIDGVNNDLTGLNFSTVMNVADVAQIIKSKLNGADVNATEDNKLLFTSNTTGATSSINLATVPAGEGTDITTAAYLNISEGSTVNGKNYIYSTVDFGIDTGTTFNAANLLATNDTPYKQGFRNYRYIGYLVVGGNNQIFSITGAKEEDELKTLRKYRRNTYIDVRHYDGEITNQNFWKIVKGAFPCTSQISIGKIDGAWFAYWGTDGVRRFRLQDGENFLDGWGQTSEKITLTDSITQETVNAYQLPAFMENEAFRRCYSKGFASTSYAKSTGNLQLSAAPDHSHNYSKWKQSGGNSGGSYLGTGVLESASTSGASSATGCYGRDGAKEVRPTNISCLTFICY